MGAVTLTTTLDDRDAAIDRQYELYKKRRDETLAAEEQLALERRAEKAKIDEFYTTRRKPPRVVTTRKPHLCHGCGEIIPAGQKVAVGTNFVRDGNLNPAFVALYFCSKCRPVVDAPKEAS